jgi:hypothetical protein
LNPTPQKKYVGWISKQWVTSKLNIDDIRSTLGVAVKETPKAEEPVAVNRPETQQAASKEKKTEEKAAPKVKIPPKTKAEEKIERTREMCRQRMREMCLGGAEPPKGDTPMGLQNEEMVAGGCRIRKNF